MQQNRGSDPYKHNQRDGYAQLLQSTLRSSIEDGLRCFGVPASDRSANRCSQETSLKTPVRY